MFLCHFLYTLLPAGTVNLAGCLIGIIKKVFKNLSDEK